MWFPFILLSAASWAWVNVLDSSIVKNYEKSPPTLMWFQSLFTVSSLFVFSRFVDTETAWWGILLAGGMVAYAGDLLFFRVLDRVDASVSNVAWAILAVILSIAGFVFFSESWNALQISGALMVITGTVLISLWHRHISLVRTLALLTALALFYAPVYVLKKSALTDGQGILQVFYWLLIGRETLAFAMPLFMSGVRRNIISLKNRLTPGFFVLNGLVIMFFFAGEYFGTVAYDNGPISLIAIVGNVQSFMVIFFGWLLSLALPAIACREKLDLKSVQSKVILLLLVFIGLALLAVSH